MAKLETRGSVVPILLLAGVIGCPACSSAPGADAPAPVLPAYTPEAARLFDDVFAPPLFGFDTEARDLARDPELRERVRQASFVQPARIETVSRVGGIEHRGAYDIVMSPLGSPLLGSYPGGSLQVTIPSSNSSYAWIEGAGASWVGTRILVFGRLYAAPGKPALHFRSEADTEELRGVVERDAALRLLR